MVDICEKNNNVEHVCHIQVVRLELKIQLNLFIIYLPSKCFDGLQQVRLQFESVSLSYGCQDDSLKIYDGNDNTASLVGPICGTSTPSDFFSNGNTVFVLFSSNGSSMQTSFTIHYSTSNDIGGNVLTFYKQHITLIELCVCACACAFLY